MAGAGVLHLLQRQARVAIGEQLQPARERRRHRAAPGIPPCGELAQPLEVSELLLAVRPGGEGRAGAQPIPGLLEEVHQGEPVHLPAEPPRQGQKRARRSPSPGSASGRQAAAEHAAHRGRPWGSARRSSVASERPTSGPRRQAAR